jgi:antitoxin MazE
MEVRIQKWGNSQGLRLAKHILESAKMQIGDDLEIIVDEEEIRLKKKKKAKFILEEMVARMPKDYVGKEESFGKPTGKEEW